MWVRRSRETRSPKRALGQLEKQLAAGQRRHGLAPFRDVVQPDQRHLIAIEHHPAHPHVGPEAPGADLERHFVAPQLCMVQALYHFRGGNAEVPADVVGEARDQAGGVVAVQQLPGPVVGDEQLGHAPPEQQQAAEGALEHAGQQPFLGEHLIVLAHAGAEHQEGQDTEYPETADVNDGRHRWLGRRQHRQGQGEGADAQIQCHVAVLAERVGAAREHDQHGHGMAEREVHQVHAVGVLGSDDPGDQTGAGIGQVPQGRDELHRGQMGEAQADDAEAQPQRTGGLAQQAIQHLETEQPGAPQRDEQAWADGTLLHDPGGGHARGN